MKKSSESPCVVYKLNAVKMSILPERRDIFHAALYDDYYAVKRFLQEVNVLPNITNSVGQTAGHIAAKNGNLRIVKLLLNTDPSLVNFKDHWNQTMLHHATQKGAIKVIKCLVDKYGADFQEPNHHLQGITVLHIAAARGHIPVLKYFINEKKMDANTRNRSGQPPVFSAAASSIFCTVKFFAEETTADLTLVDNLGDNILYMSAKKGDLLVPKYLLHERKVKFDLNWRNKLGETIITRAVVHDQYNFVRHFVETENVDVNIADNEGNTPLHEAATLNDFILVRYLVQHGADSATRNKERKTAAQTTTDARITKYVEEAIRNRTLSRGRRNARLALTIPTLQAQSNSAIHKWSSLSWISRSSKNRNSNNNENDLNLTGFDSLLVLANACFHHIVTSRYQQINNLSMLSPYDLLQIRMDSFAVNSIEFYR